MGQRQEDNIRVKDAIADAFLTLLRSYSPDSISVAQITRTAHVSRVSFYRNFDSKMDIIHYFVERRLAEISEILEGNVSLWTREYAAAFFTSMRKHADEHLLLHETGYSGVILNIFNHLNEIISGDMPYNSMDRYDLYFTAGASYNAALQWIKGGCRETPEELVEAYFRYRGLP